MWKFTYKTKISKKKKRVYYQHYEDFVFVFPQLICVRL